MNIHTTPSVEQPAFHRHLHANERDLVRHNIVLRVDSINTVYNTALCTVRQRRTGWMRQRRSRSELLWRAEQALAPLRSIGLLPLVTVHSDRTRERVGFIRSPRLWSVGTIRRFIHPFGRAVRSFSLLGDDPFGWQQALRNADHA